jgi:GxxExxY protein
LKEKRGITMAKWGKAELTDKIINACISVHTELGPGFLEGIYHNALLIEMKKQSITFESEKDVTISYDGAAVGVHKIDLFIENEIVLELKTVDDLNKKHYAQVRSYLKALHKPIGLLVNFWSYKLDVRRVELERT